MKFFYDSLLVFAGAALFSTVFSATTVLAQETSSNQSTTKLDSKNFDLSTNFSLGAWGYKEFQDQSEMVLLSANPKATYNITSDFGVTGDVQVNMVTGRAQSRFQNPNFNLLNVMELAAFYKPAAIFDVKAGAINQDHFANPMLIANRGFPGVVLRSGYVGETVKIRPKVQYAIPTSTSFESDRTQAEALPTLTTYGVEGEWQAMSWLGFKANINQFQFKNLPAVVAYDSSRLGNSVIGSEPTEAKFRYQFQGLSQSYGVKVDYTKKLAQKFDFMIIDNSEAPSDRRRSQWVGTGLNMQFKDFTVSPEFAMFFAESDSVPSIYSAFGLGRNNREGQHYGLTVDLKKLGVAIRADFVDARLIEPRPLQADLQILNFALEFNNVAL